MSAPAFKPGDLVRFGRIVHYDKRGPSGGCTVVFEEGDQPTEEQLREMRVEHIAVAQVVQVLPPLMPDDWAQPELGRRHEEWRRRENGEELRFVTADSDGHGFEAYTWLTYYPYQVRQNQLWDEALAELEQESGGSP